MTGIDNFTFACLVWYGTGHAGCWDLECNIELKEEAMRGLLDLGMMSAEGESQGIHDKCNRLCQYHITKKGQVWVDHIKTIPFPIETYTIPEKE